MRWFPFISRERFEELKERCERLEQENRILQADLIAAKIEAKLTPPSAAGRDLNWQPIPGKPTIVSVMGEANRAAYSAAQTPGAKGVAREMQEREKQTLKAAHGN